MITNTDHSAELLDELNADLAKGAEALRSPGVGLDTVLSAVHTLQAAAQTAHHVLLHDPASTHQQSYRQFTALFDTCQQLYKHATRTADVRAELLQRLGPRPGVDSTPTLLALKVFDADAMGRVLLDSFSARPARLGSGDSGSWCLLSLPAWAAQNLASGWLSTSLDHSYPQTVACADRSIAETTATLWCPDSPTSPYATLDCAFLAAKKLLR